MAWKIGESGGGHEGQRTRNPVLVEDCPVARASVGHRPAGVTVVVVRSGICRQTMFQCDCGRVCQAVYAPQGAAWACRKCHNLSYASRHTWIGGPLKQAAKLRAQLGGLPSSLAALPSREQARMGPTRYNRIVARIERLERAGSLDTARVLRSVGRLMEEAADERHEPRGGAARPADR